jgi:hypothetical protein
MENNEIQKKVNNEIVIALESISNIVTKQNEFFKDIAKIQRETVDVLEKHNEDIKYFYNSLGSIWKILKNVFYVVIFAEAIWFINLLDKLSSTLYSKYWVHEAHDTHLAILQFGGSILAAIIAYPCYRLFKFIFSGKLKE